MRKEKVNALLSGKVVSSFLKIHSEIVSVLENFIVKFPCFKKITEVLVWLQNGVKIKKWVVCGKRIDYQKGKRDEALFCFKKIKTSWLFFNFCVQFPCQLKLKNRTQINY